MLAVNNYCAWRDVCAVSRGISMKLGRNIRFKNTQCCKGFPYRRSTLIFLPTQCILTNWGQSEKWNCTEKQPDSYDAEHKDRCRHIRMVGSATVVRQWSRLADLRLTGRGFDARGLRDNLRQPVHGRRASVIKLVIRYRCKSRKGNSRRRKWDRCRLLFMMQLAAMKRKWETEFWEWEADDWVAATLQKYDSYTVYL